MHGVFELDDLSQDMIRCDATTVSGDHEVTEGGLAVWSRGKMIRRGPRAT